MKGLSQTAVMHAVDQVSWLAGLRRYLVLVTILNLIWEIAQLPLYTIWRTGTLGDNAFAALHCTAGDLLIAAASLLGALLLLGRPGWPTERYGATVISAVLAGLAYTILSEWINTEIRRSWAYSDLMPTLPWIGTCLSPFAQWIVVPVASFLWLGRIVRHPQQIRKI